MTTISIVCLILFALYIFNKNKQANPNLLSKPPSTSTKLKFEFDANSIYKSILNFSQSSDYKISHVNETKLELILNYTPKMGEQTNGTFFPIWVKAISSDTCEVTVGAKDKSLALKFEETSALNKLVNYLKAYLISNTVKAHSNASFTSNIETFTLDDFTGNRTLDNDSYRLYLVKKYKVEKNSVLDGFVLMGKIFNTLDDVLGAAHQKENESHHNDESVSKKSPTPIETIDTQSVKLEAELATEKNEQLIEIKRLEELHTHEINLYKSDLEKLLAEKNSSEMLLDQLKLENEQLIEIKSREELHTQEINLYKSDLERLLAEKNRSEMLVEQLKLEKEDIKTHSEITKLNQHVKLAALLLSTAAVIGGVVYFLIEKNKINDAEQSNISINPIIVKDIVEAEQKVKEADVKDEKIESIVKEDLPKSNDAPSTEESKKSE